MYQKLFTTLLFMLSLSIAYSQNMPKGMNYQAVARNLKGEILPNEPISLKIYLVSNQNRDRKEYFSEIHTVTTNDLGLFSLIVGEGLLETGNFNEVPWATENIWMEVAIKDKTQTRFNTISNSKLFAVPYALHAFTANTLIGDPNQIKDQTQAPISSFAPPGIGAISTSWSVLGNQKTDASGNIYRLNSLGTTDFVDLFLITDNVERMRITASGDIKTKLNFEVGKSVLLNAVSGSTINNGPFTVDKMSPTILTGTLRVDKSFKLNDSLVVNGMKPTILTGTLRVDKSTRLNDSLTVTNMKPTLLTGTLTVDKHTDLNSTLNVDKSTTLNDSLTVTGMKPTLLTGTLTVDKAVDLNNTLNVDKSTKLNDSLTVTGMKPTLLTGTLTVDKPVDLNSTLNVDKATFLNDSLTVTGMKPTHLTGSLTVDKELFLSRPAAFSSSLAISDTLRVLNMAPSILTGKLRVDKATTLNDTLTVTGMKPTLLTGTLTVDKHTELNSTLNVDKATTLNDTLTVTSLKPVYFTGKLKVDKPATFNDSVIVNGGIYVKKDIPDGGYVAIFENTNAGTGDGIKIRLGRDKASYTIPSSKDTLTSTQLTKIKSLLNCSTSLTTRGNLLGEIVTDGLLEDLKLVGGLAVAVGNMLINKINSGIGLPYNISTPINSGLSLPLNISTPINNGIGLPYNFATPINSGLGLPIPFGPYSIPKIDFPKLAVPGFVVDVPVIPTFTLPGFTVVEAFTLVPKLDLIPKFDIVPKLPDITIPAIPNFAIPALPTLTIPAIPNIDLTSIGVPEIPLGDLDFWGVPSICMIDETTNPLNNENVFIRFTDKADLKLGSIRAVSVVDWATDFLNPIFLYGLREAFTSSVADKKHALYHVKYEAKKALKAYAEIGVEYSSGNGDYAEWLCRVNPEEFISKGDIVGVIGGKITKDLTAAEQVMAISHNPIVLGNIPAEGKVAYGNNVAFMGQVPVKILGPVATGDYILGNAATPGYGIAKKQADMTISDFKYAVGRSWENNNSTGPIMVNTVIGVHNGDYLKILKKYEEKFEKTESRLHSLEQKIEVLLEKSNK